MVAEHIAKPIEGEIERLELLRLDERFEYLFAARRAERRAAQIDMHEVAVDCRLAEECCQRVRALLSERRLREVEMRAADEAGKVG